MHFSSFVPLGTQAGHGRQTDRSPDLRLVSAAFPRTRVRSGLRTRPSGTVRWLIPFPFCPTDGLQGRCAHSCGAVTDFHRLPEHPGDCRNGLRDPGPSRRAHETTLPCHQQSTPQAPRQVKTEKPPVMGGWEVRRGPKAVARE